MGILRGGQASAIARARTAPSRSTAPLDAATARLGLFNGLLAFGILVHLANTGSWELLHHETVLALVAIWALLSPTSVPRFLALVATQIVSWAIKAPGGNNHWLLVMLAGLSILLCVAVLAARGDRRPDASTLFRTIAPVLRVEIILLYAIAGFSKLNRDFFDTELSAAVGMYGELRERVPFLPEGAAISQGVIWGTIAVEFAIPLLLLFRRSRMVAVLLALGFHFVMAIAGHTPFSALAMAFLSLFLPDGFTPRLRSWLSGPAALDRAIRDVADRARHPSTLIILAGGWLLASTVQTYEWLDPDTVRRLLIRGSQAAYALEAVAAVAILVPAVMAFRTDDHAPGTLRFAHPILLACPLLLLVNAASPYLGLKTENSFTMFSNLQTESTQWNHLVIPEAVRVFTTQDDLVEIVRSDDPELASDADESLRWVDVHFRHYVSERPQVTVTFVHRGEEHTIEPGVESEFTERPGVVERKLMKYRKVPLPENNTLRH